MICKDFLKSCNCIMKRSLFLKHGGMNKKRYIGEDKDLFEKLRKKVKNFKALFTPDVFIYHKDRPISKFLLQRLSFGTDIFTPSSNFWYYSLLSYMPTFVLLSTLLLLFFSEILLIYKFYLCLIIIIIPNIMIYLELRNYIKKFKDIVITALVINAVNILYAIGGLIALTGLKKLLEKKLSLPAYDQCLKASHLFNLLDARGVIGVAERTGYINRIRELAKGSGAAWLNTQV